MQQHVLRVGHATHPPLDFLLSAGTALCCWCTVSRTVVSSVSCSVVRGSGVHQLVPRNPLPGATLCTLVDTAFACASHILRSPGVLLSGGVSASTPCTQPLRSSLPTRVRVRPAGDGGACLPGPACWAPSSPCLRKEGPALRTRGTLPAPSARAPAWVRTSAPRAGHRFFRGHPSASHGTRGRVSGPWAASLHRPLRLQVTPFPPRRPCAWHPPARRGLPPGSRGGRAAPAAAAALRPPARAGPGGRPRGRRAGARRAAGHRTPPTPLGDSRGGGAAVPSPGAARPLLLRAPPLLRAASESGLCRARAAAAAGAGSQPCAVGPPWRRRQRRPRAAAATAAAAAAAAPRRRARRPRPPPPAAGCRAGRRPRGGWTEAGGGPAAAAAPARRRPARGARRRPVAAAGGGSRCWKGRSANTPTFCKAGRAGKPPGRLPAALRGRVLPQRAPLLTPSRPQDGVRAAGAAAPTRPLPGRRGQVGRAVSPALPEARLPSPPRPLPFVLCCLSVFPSEGAVGRKDGAGGRPGVEPGGAGQGGRSGGPQRPRRRCGRGRGRTRAAQAVLPAAFRS